MLAGAIYNGLRFFQQVSAKYTVNDFVYAMVLQPGIDVLKVHCRKFKRGNMKFIY